MNNVAAIIMAAGKSKRMKTKSSKVLHKLMGKPLIDYVLETAKDAGVDRAIMITGHEKEAVMQYLGDRTEYAFQLQQKGTGHAVMQGMEKLKNFKGSVVVLSGDMPLLTSDTLKKLMERHSINRAVLTVLTAKLDNPGKLGRIVRDHTGKVKAIVEAVDATKEQLNINEINTGTYVFEYEFLKDALPHIGSNNAQGEIYLTDTVGMAINEGLPVEALPCDDPGESLGVNSRADLAAALKALKEKINHRLMMAGVTIYDPAATYIEPSVEIADDVEILPGCMITGDTKIGTDCVIGPNCRIEGSVIGRGCEVRESVILQSVIGDNAAIGPYAHMRPESVLENNVKIGNFVETKKSHVGSNSKLPHLTYAGDATIGENVNVGAGTITCNYDGVRKNPTTIKNNAFIGSNSSLVAPVVIGEGAATGAGSIVTKDVPDYMLAVGQPARAIKTLKR